LVWSADRFVRLSIWVAALAVALALLWLASVAGLQTYRSYNEGWNAYHAVAAMTGGALYPRPPSLMANNYPPLSFYIVGLTGKVVGDMIVAGRIVSLLGTLIACWAVFAIGRAMGAARILALFAASLFAGKLLAASNFVGIDDPQMLGHAFGCLGFLLIAAEPRSTWRIVLGALLLTLAMFVKHMLVIQPLVLLVWLALIDRASAIRFAVFGILFALFGCVLCCAGLGVDLFDVLFSPRGYRIEWLAQSLKDFLLVSFAPLGAGLYLLRSKDRYALLCGIYTLAAFVIGLAFEGGAGVGRNALFDAAIAGALSAALLMPRLRPGWAPAFALACLVPLAVAGWQRIERADPTERMAASMRAGVDYLKAHPGPALCERLSLCYWAGKPAGVDAFNFVQSVHAHARSEEDLVRLLDRRYFSVIELETKSRFDSLPDVSAAIERNYRVGRTGKDETLLLPRAPALQ
jgi:hypothetical protein